MIVSETVMHDGAVYVSTSLLPTHRQLPSQSQGQVESQNQAKVFPWPPFKLTVMTMATKRRLRVNEEEVAKISVSLSVCLSVSLSLSLSFSLSLSLSVCLSVCPFASTFFQSFPSFFSLSQAFDNMIGPVVECVRYQTSLSHDVLAYVLLCQLADTKSKVKEDGINEAHWFQSLAAFSGQYYRKYPDVEMDALLIFIMNQLKDNRSHDLLILKELVSHMAGVERKSLFGVVFPFCVFGCVFLLGCCF